MSCDTYIDKGTPDVGLAASLCVVAVAGLECRVLC